MTDAAGYSLKRNWYSRALQSILPRSKSNLNLLMMKLPTLPALCSELDLTLYVSLDFRIISIKFDADRRRNKHHGNGSHRFS